MQSRGGRRHRALIGREHGLVVGHILVVGRPPRGDVGRQWWVAEIGNGLVKRGAVKRKRQRDLAINTLGLDLSVEMTEQAYPAFVAETDSVAR
jgi:hypothetical protein